MEGRIGRRCPHRGCRTASSMAMWLSCLTAQVQPRRRTRTQSCCGISLSSKALVVQPSLGSHPARLAQSCITQGQVAAAERECPWAFVDLWLYYLGLGESKLSFKLTNLPDPLWACAGPSSYPIPFLDLLGSMTLSYPVFSQARLLPFMVATWLLLHLPQQGNFSLADSPHPHLPLVYGNRPVFPWGERKSYLSCLLQDCPFDGGRAVP